MNAVTDINNNTYGLWKRSYFPTANIISFNQTAYDADEENESVQIVFILSGPLTNDTTMQVISNNINATGM